MKNFNMYMKNYHFAFFMIGFFILLLIFVNAEVGAENNRIKVASGIVPLETFVEKVGGEKVQTVTLIPPGYSPANYAPGSKLMKELSTANLYFTLEMPAERANILPELDSFNKDIEVVKLNKLVAEKYKPRYFKEDHEHGENDHSHGDVDPHIWLSPKRVIYMIDIIADTLSEYDQNNKDYYQNNAEEYKLKINKLDEEIREELSQIKEKTVLIYHPVIGYYTDEYNLEMKAIEEDGKKATPQKLQSLIEYAREKNVEVVFHQATVDSRQTEVIANEIGANTVEINPLAEDYIATMKEITELIVDYNN